MVFAGLYPADGVEYLALREALEKLQLNDAALTFTPESSLALGTGFRQGVYWRDMEVVNLPSGKPTMLLTGGAAERLQSLTPSGMTTQIDVSLTDEPPTAQAIEIITAQLTTQE